MFGFLSSCASNILYDEIPFFSREPSTFQSCFNYFEKFLKNNPENKYRKKFYQANNLDELEATYENKSFIDIQKSFSNDLIVSSNKKTESLLSLPLSNGPNQNYTNYLTVSELDILYKK